MPDPVRVGPFAEGTNIWVVIETPAGGRTKYKWDDKAHAYRAGRVLPLGMAFPFDFGFVPGTKAEDGTVTPLDVKAGDKILFGKWSGTEVKLDGQDLLIMKESDILGIVG